MLLWMMFCRKQALIDARDLESLGFESREKIAFVVFQKYFFESKQQIKTNCNKTFF
jgi:hypothetical protein